MATATASAGSSAPAPGCGTTARRCTRFAFAPDRPTLLPTSTDRSRPMPLSPPVEREPIHIRTVTCRGYRRSDGLWDIEGHLVDTKAYLFESRWRGTLAPGEPV